MKIIDNLQGLLIFTNMDSIHLGYLLPSFVFTMTQLAAGNDESKMKAISSIFFSHLFISFLFILKNTFVRNYSSDIISTAIYYFAMFICQIYYF